MWSWQMCICHTSYVGWDYHCKIKIKADSGDETNTVWYLLSLSSCLMNGPFIISFWCALFSYCIEPLALLASHILLVTRTHVYFYIINQRLEIMNDRYKVIGYCKYLFIKANIFTLIHSNVKLRRFDWFNAMLPINLVWWFEKKKLLNHVVFFGDTILKL